MMIDFDDELTNDLIDVEVERAIHEFLRDCLPKKLPEGYGILSNENSTKVIHYRWFTSVDKSYSVFMTELGAYKGAWSHYLTNDEDFRAAALATVQSIAPGDK